jgi:hypothetical protein
VPWSTQLPKENIYLWQIVPKDANYVEAANLPRITYGQVPAGWVQKVPTSGEPPRLLDGHVYEVGGPQVEVPYFRQTQDGMILRMVLLAWVTE